MRLLAWIAAWCATALALGEGASAKSAPSAETVARYLADRDPRALDATLEEAGFPPGAPSRVLARLAAHGLDATTREILADPLAASPVARAVAALHELDLRGACAAVRCGEETAGDVAASWLGALLLARRGDDSGAIGRILGPIEVRTDADRYRLALLADALPAPERAMLAGCVRRALFRAAERGRVAAIEGLRLGIVTIDPSWGAEVDVAAVRAVRRAGRADLARAMLDRLPRDDPALDLERVLLDGGSSGSSRLASHHRAPVLGPILVALARGAEAPAAWRTREPLAHATGIRHDAILIARLCRRHGVDSSAEQVMRAAERDGATASRAAWATAHLALQNLALLHGADDESLARDLAARGVPFLLWRIERVGVTYRERAVLVLGRDAQSGTWWIDEPDLERPDVLSPDAVAKGRFVAVARRDDAHGFLALRARPGAMLGSRLEAVRARADAGDRSAARALLADAGTSPVAALARGLLAYEEVLAEPALEGWAEAADAIAPSIAVPPRTGFEAFLAAQAAAIRGDASAALAALDQVRLLEGESPSLHLVRYAALASAGRRDEALAALARAAAIDPLDTRPLLYRGTARGVDPLDALPDLTRAFERQPEDPRTAVALATVLARLNRRPDALEVLRVARRHARDDADRRIVDAARQQVELRVIEEASTGDALTGFERSADPETRRRAAFQLASLNTPEAEVQLRGLLLDASADLRLTVLRLYLRPWLRRIAEDDPVLGRRLVGLMSDDPDVFVRAAAARLLGHLSAPFAGRALADRLRGRTADPAPAVRAAAALALRGREDHATRSALVAALADDEVSVRRAACDALFEQTATRRGFDPAGRPEERIAAIRLWRTWLDEVAATE